jgi:hypothetical protein
LVTPPLWFCPEHHHERVTGATAVRVVFTGRFTTFYLYVYTSVYLAVFTYIVMDGRGDAHASLLVVGRG